MKSTKLEDMLDYYTVVLLKGNSFRVSFSLLSLTRGLVLAMRLVTFG